MEMGAAWLLSHVGEDPVREGLLETPSRYRRAWEYWTRGYHEDLTLILKTFEDGADGYDEMVVETDIPVYSKCEHHLADIFGVAHIGYIPNGRIVGLSKLVRVVEHFARRLQVQERLTVQIAEALDNALRPKGVAVMLQCRHMCMESRGVNRPGVVTTTTQVRGALKEVPEARAEFMSIVGSRRSV
jgi:GTP cyclohydrolase I